METRKLISALCYFSIFFAGFLVPGVVYLITNDYEIRYHAKKSLLSHIVPFFSLFIVVILWLTSPTLGNLLIYALLVAALYFFVILWNVFKGIQVLLER